MFENTTRIKREHLVCVTHLRCKTPVMLAYRIGLVIFAAMFVAFGATDPNITDKLLDFGVAILFVLMAVWFFPAILLTRSLRAVNFDDVRRYSVGKDGLTCYVDGPGVSAQETISYDRFDELTVGRDGLYLRMAKVKQYLVLDREGFTKGTADEAAKLIESTGMKTVWSNAK